MKQMKALGISKFKPSTVTYNITLKEFAETASIYVSTKFNHRVEFEGRYDEEDGKRIGLYFKDFDPIPIEIAHAMAQWGITESTAYQNMDHMLRYLFNFIDFDMEDFRDEYGIIMLYVTTEFQYYLDNDGPNATHETSVY